VRHLLDDPDHLAITRAIIGLGTRWAAGVAKGETAGVAAACVLRIARAAGFLYQTHAPKTCLLDRQVQTRRDRAGAT